MRKNFLKAIALSLVAVLTISAVTISASAKEAPFRYRIRLNEAPYNGNAVVYLGAGECYTIGVDHYSEGVEFFDLLAEGNNVKLLSTNKVDNSYSHARVQAHSSASIADDYVGVVSKRYAKGVKKDSLYGNKYALYTIFKVKPAPKSVSLNKKSVVLRVGQRCVLKENTNKCSYANPQNIKWTSTNNAIATTAKYGDNGCIVSANRRGTVNIKVRTYNGKTATCRVTVK